MCIVSGMTWMAVAIGGALGSLARHGVNMFFGHVLERSVPYATATVNIAGSVIIGLLAGLVAIWVGYRLGVLAGG